MTIAVCYASLPYFGGRLLVPPCALHRSKEKLLLTHDELMTQVELEACGRRGLKQIEEPIANGALTLKYRNILRGHVDDTVRCRIGCSSHDHVRLLAKRGELSVALSAS